jgi:hypothetical protein
LAVEKRMDITLEELARLEERLDTADLNEPDRLVLRRMLALARNAVTGGAEAAESRSPQLLRIQPGQPAVADGATVQPLADGFEGALRPGAAASFDLSKGAPARPESLRITARFF